METVFLDYYGHSKNVSGVILKHDIIVARRILVVGWKMFRLVDIWISIIGVF